ncbi:hypothetical protein PIB30_084546 [Stylosanthes scabra]|uniref:Uncharacterized protein n=1 Tax=Stylosanthes scabra TaxID=79078 RepID=A0ABU6QS46_9FABA|nr:hypothetical protein [Stylosanthes scabra]
MFSSLLRCRCSASLYFLFFFLTFLIFTTLSLLLFLFFFPFFSILSSLGFFFNLPNSLNFPSFLSSRFVESSNSFAKMMMHPGLVSNLQEALQNRKVRDKSVSGYSVTYKETMEACSAKVSSASAFEISVGQRSFLHLLDFSRAKTARFLRRNSILQRSLRKGCEDPYSLQLSQCKFIFWKAGKAVNVIQSLRCSPLCGIKFVQVWRIRKHM